MSWDLLIACFVLLDLAAVFAIGWLVFQIVTLAWRTHEQSCLVSRSQQESATKYVTAVSQTANLISEKVDSRVAARVKTINTMLRGAKAEEATEPIEEAPQPDVFQSGFVNELSEIERELTRMRRDNEEYPARESGIGADDI